MEPLLRASATLTGKSLMGSRAAVSDAKGAFRFSAFPQGEYSLKAELAGFKTIDQENNRRTTTISLTVGIALEETAIAQEITVLAKAPTVDVRCSATSHIVSSPATSSISRPASRQAEDRADQPGIGSNEARPLPSPGHRCSCSPLWEETINEGVGYVKKAAYPPLQEEVRSSFEPRVSSRRLR